MGEKTVPLSLKQEDLNKFMHFLINDIKALEKMLAADMFEKDIQRIGAEQELCLLDKSWRPAPLIMDVLKAIDDPHFTTEHSQYNLEINLDPLEFTGTCLSQMQNALEKHIAKLNKVVKELDGILVLVGILPTIRQSDLELENLTPLPRYHLLSEIMNRIKEGVYQFRIQGIDELITKHNSIMFEGCNTSFQIHLQVSPDTFVNDYNWAQAITAPVMAVAVNSPILLGKQLWQETRIALFQQSVDTRRRGFNSLRHESSRITFGEGWVKNSITEIFQQDIIRHRVLLGTEIKEDALKALKAGTVPSLQALRIHNGTVYRWNRACYGITDGKPHLRIENRILPAGPTLGDEMANSAFWLGLMNGIPDNYKNIAEKMNFNDAKSNFIKAARYGLETQLKWVGGKIIPVDVFILKELLPIAKEGLKKAGIVENEIEHYLGIIEERVKSKNTGSKWMLDSFAKLQTVSRRRYEACVAITAGIVNRQKTGIPVHKWTLADIDEAGDWVNRYWKVEQIMYTNLFTVQESDPLYFASNIMTWKNLRYIPVEDEIGNLTGLLTASALLEYYSNKHNIDNRKPSVKRIMDKNPLTVGPGTLSIEAFTLMQNSKIGCLPVVQDNRLVGIVTEQSFTNFHKYTMETLMRQQEGRGDKP